MTLLQSCSRCDKINVWVTGGKNSKFENLYVDSSAKEAKQYFWQRHFREIFWDVDGSLAGQANSYAVPYKEHLREVCEVSPS